ncbi:MAG: SPOR domain-containing protein [Proteobacteria bacterium]|nr:SPOR domain-containing protein [Pseudomonadota bacterium]
MPGTTMPKQHALVTTLTLTALAGLLALTGCSPRQPIPLDQPRIATKAPAEAPAEQAKPAKVAKPQAKVAPAKTTPAKPTQQVELPPVILDTLTPEAPAAVETAPAVAERKNYVQVGAFGTAMNALGAVAWLKDKGYENSRMVRVEQGQGTLYRVQAGPFQDLAAAHKVLEALKPDWPQAFIPLD